MPLLHRLVSLVLAILALGLCIPGSAASSPSVVVVPMSMPILPGTQLLLARAIDEASSSGAKLIVIQLNTPGGMLHTSQEMIQEIFQSPIPVVVYVSPSGGTATSAGVFITLAGHVAVMAPGTSIGAAHPVDSGGKDIDGDMRQKVENITTAMVKSIAEERGRNVKWAEKAVKESASLTEAEAVKEHVVDFIARDLDDLLKQLAGREVKLQSGTVKLENVQQLPRVTIVQSLSEEAINVLAYPEVLALLWLAATGGISLELYSPGLILPGVVGVISLVIALALSQVIPINSGAVLLIVLGGLLMGGELFLPSGILGAGGIIAIILGALYLIDTSQAPDLAVSLRTIAPVALVLGGLVSALAVLAFRAKRRRPVTGENALIGQKGRAMETFTTAGKVHVNGEIWNATATAGVVERDAKIEVVAVKPGMLLEVRIVE